MNYNIFMSRTNNSNKKEYDVGKKIALLRKLKGLTQEELADIMNIERTAIANYETGRLRIYDIMLKRFAIALCVSTDEILGLSEALQNTSANLKIVKRLKEIEELPVRQKAALLNTIDAYLKSNKKQAK